MPDGMHYGKIDQFKPGKIPQCRKSKVCGGFGEIELSYRLFQLLPRRSERSNKRILFVHRLTGHYLIRRLHLYIEVEEGCTKVGHMLVRRTIFCCP